MQVAQEHHDDADLSEANRLNRCVSLGLSALPMRISRPKVSLPTPDPLSAHLILYRKTDNTCPCLKLLAGIAGKPDAGCTCSSGRN